jgi:hypothetical protein
VGGSHVNYVNGKELERKSGSAEVIANDYRKIDLRFHNIDFWKTATDSNTNTAFINVLVVQKLTPLRRSFRS